MTNPESVIATEPKAQQEAPIHEIELGGDHGAESPGAPGAPAGTDADLEGAAEALAFSPSALIVSIAGQIIAGPQQQSAAAGRPLTPQERFAGFAGLLIGDGDKTPGLLQAIDFDRNVLALLSRAGVGSNLSPGVAVAIGGVAIVGAAFLFRGPKPAAPQNAAARPAQQPQTTTATPQSAPQGRTA